MNDEMPAFRSSLACPLALLAGISPALATTATAATGDAAFQAGQRCVRRRSAWLEGELAA